MSILVIAEHDNASLVGATLNTVTAAQQIADAREADHVAELQRLKQRLKLLA